MSLIFAKKKAVPFRSTAFHWEAFTFSFSCLPFSFFSWPQSSPPFIKNNSDKTVYSSQPPSSSSEPSLVSNPHSSLLKALDLQANTY